MAENRLDSSTKRGADRNRAVQDTIEGACQWNRPETVRQIGKAARFPLREGLPRHSGPPRAAP